MFFSFLLLLSVNLCNARKPFVRAREVDWIFSSEAGRSQLADSAGFERLVLITLHRGHTYSGIEEVREEVGKRAVDLAQAGLPKGEQVRGRGGEGEGRGERGRERGIIITCVYSYFMVPYILPVS